MLDVKNAVAAALSFVNDVYGDKLEGLRLEEVEHVSGFWLVTIGYWEQLPPKRSALAQLQEPLHKRVYKVLRVDEDTGKVHSMKLRE